MFKLHACTMQSTCIPVYQALFGPGYIRGYMYIFSLLFESRQNATCFLISLSCFVTCVVSEYWALYWLLVVLLLGWGTFQACFGAQLVGRYLARISIACLCKRSAQFFITSYMYMICVLPGKVHLCV